jgi:hypothetical protein
MPMTVSLVYAAQAQVQSPMNERSTLPALGEVKHTYEVANSRSGGKHDLANPKLRENGGGGAGQGRGAADPRAGRADPR